MDAEKRNILVSILAGMLCSIAWWSVIVGWVRELEFQEVQPANLFPNNTINQTRVDEQMFSIQGIWAIPAVGFIGLAMLNLIGNSSVRSDFGMDGQTLFARIFLFVAFLCLLVSFVAAIWTSIEAFLQSKIRSNNLGWLLLIESIVMMLSGLIFKFGRDENAWNGF